MKLGLAGRSASSETRGHNPTAASLKRLAAATYQRARFSQPSFMALPDLHGGPAQRKTSPVERSCSAHEKIVVFSRLYVKAIATS